MISRRETRLDKTSKFFRKNFAKLKEETPDLVLVYEGDGYFCAVAYSAHLNKFLYLNASANMSTKRWYYTEEVLGHSASTEWVLVVHGFIERNNIK